MDNELIIYLDINEFDDKTGADVISFVYNPATKITWNKFNEAKKHSFSKDEVKRVITGPVMLADTPIRRYSDVIGDYFVKFSKESIFKMVKKYFKENKIHNTNEEHNKKTMRVGDGIYMIESFIVGDRVTSELYPELPEGTWVASFFIEDENYWNNIIMGDEFKGFSLEGKFIEYYEDEVIEQVYSEVENILNSNLSDDEKEIKIKSVLNIK